MEITVTYFFPTVLTLDGKTYAHNDLIIAVCKSMPRHYMDTNRILCYGQKQVSEIDSCKRLFEEKIKKYWYKEDSDKITSINFVYNCDYDLPNKNYFQS